MPLANRRQTDDCAEDAIFIEDLMHGMMRGLKLALAFGTCVSATVAFLPPSPVSSISFSRSQFRAFDGKLSAKRRRRRTNDETNELAQPVGDDLPEFDLEPELSGDGSPNNLEYLSSDDPFKVSEAMMGKESPVRSVKELITDRALERSFKFDEPLSGESLPDLTAFEVALGTEKKKSRKEARREAAIKAKADENSDLLKDVPAMFQGEDGKFSPVKVIESATWAGIFILVAWEVYLNSPLFDRAAPLAPIVYQFVL